MSQAFSPYHQWLGLPAESLSPNHYELLSLAAGEKDIKTIAAAAEQAATKVRSIRPGAHAADWARILDEIHQAKLTLLDPARKADYDRRLATGRGQEPRAPSHAGSARQSAAPSASELFPPGFKQSGAGGQGPATRSRESNTKIAGVAETPAESRDIEAPSAIPQAAYGSYVMPTAGQPMLPQPAVPQGMSLDPMAPVAIPGVTLPPAGTPMMPMGVASGYPVAAPYAPIPQATAYAPYSAAAASAISAPTGGEQQDAMVPGMRKQSAASVLMAARKQRQLRRAALFGGALAGLAVVGGLVGYAVWNSQRDKANSDVLVADAGNAGNSNESPIVKPGGTSGPKGLVDTPRPMPPVEDPQPMPMPEPEPGPSPEPEPMPRTPEPAPMPMPTPPPQPAPVKPTRQQIVELEAALKKSRQALGERALDEAQGAIATAEPLALTADHQGKVERLRLAIEHTRLFREELPKAAAKLDAAETIKVGTSTVVSIVETFPDKITVRLSGMNRTYSFDTIPQGLAAAILDAKRVGGQPDTRTLKAMYFGSEADADEDTINEARGWLAEAAASDPNAQSLMLFFDDTYELVKEFDEEAKTASVSP